MLLSSIFVVAREMLEATYVGGLLFALMQIESLPKRAFGMGGLGGILGAVVFAYAINDLSASFGGNGYEIWVTGMYATMAIGISAVMWMVWFRVNHLTVLQGVVAIVWGLSLIKELGEILLYLLPFVGEVEAAEVLFGGFVGLLVGLSGGVLVFLLLVRFNRRWMKGVTSVLLAFMAGGLAMHCVGLLTQAGLLPYQAQLYSMYSLLEEESFLGHMLQRIFCYESSPTLNQVVAYWVVVTATLMPIVLKWRSRVL